MKRRFPALPLLALSLVILLLPAAAAAEPLAWRSWNDGIKEARTSKRLILVDVYTDWCGWCKRMDRDVYARADVRDYLSRRFVPIKLDAEANHQVTYEGKVYTARKLALRFGVRSYPMTVFLRPQGEHVVNVPGYLPADRFLLLLRYIGDGHLDRGVPFEDFVRRAGATR